MYILTICRFASFMPYFGDDKFSDCSPANKCRLGSRLSWSCYVCNKKIEYMVRKAHNPCPISTFNCYLSHSIPH